MGIVAHFWSKESGRPATAALDIIHLSGSDVGLEFVAETLKHAFDKTDLNATRIYRTIVESSGRIGRSQG
jgi:3-hydroxyacyl-CoA dehydrogenase